MSKYNEEDLKNHDAVAGVIYNEECDILMLYHNKHECWTLPMGKVKDGQSVTDAIKTEMFEELGLIVLNAHELTSKVNTYCNDGVNIEVNEHLFLIDMCTGKLENKEPEKHREMKFMSLFEICHLKEKISPVTKMYIQYIRDAIS